MYRLRRLRTALSYQSCFTVAVLRLSSKSDDFACVNDPRAAFTAQSRHKEYAEPGPSLPWVLDDFFMPILIFDFAPEFIHLTFCISIVHGDIVQRDESAAAYQRRVHFKVPPHPFVTVVPIQKQIVERLAIENFRHCLATQTQKRAT